MAHIDMKGLKGIIYPGQRSYWIVLVLVILIQCEICPASPPHGNRAKRDVGDQPVMDFIRNLQTQEMDLVILMERSAYVGRWRFFLRAKKLVSHVLRYYTKIGPSNVRVALVTFAGDVTVHFKGMQNQGTDLLKCDVWNTYWKDVTVVDNPLIWRESEVKMAYEKAKDIFNQYGSPPKKRYIWILTSGAYDDTGVSNPIPIRNELVNNMDVEIVATKTSGNEGDNDKIILIASSPEHHGKEVVDWRTRLKKFDPINDPPSLEQINQAEKTYCDKTYGFLTKGLCANSDCDSGTCDEDCVCTQNFPALRICPRISVNHIRVCEMLSGKTGRYCDMDDVECVHNSCANGGTCLEEPSNTFSCICPARYNPIFHCELNCTNLRPGECGVPPTINASTAREELGGGLGGGLGLLLILFLVVGGCCIWRKKKRSAQTSDAETYTNADRLEVTREVTTTTTTKGTITIFPRFKNNVAPPLPVSLPPSICGPVANPTYRQFPHRPAAPKRPSLKPSVFKWIPPHLWSTPGSKVIDSPKEDIKEDDSDIYNDTESYENAGSKKMPGWDKYVWELAANSDMRNLAIVRYDRSGYVTTCTVWFLPSKEELNHIYRVLKDQLTNVTISIKASSYKVTKNDGKMIEAWLTGRALDVLCVGMSKQYLTLGVKTDPNNTGNCYSEIKFIRDHLSSQGK